MRHRERSRVSGEFLNRIPRLAEIDAIMNLDESARRPV